MRTDVDALVLGAGAIGLFLGGKLAASGQRVHFVGRPAISEHLRQHGLRLLDINGREQRLAASDISASESLDQAPAARLVLLTVKGGATAAAASELASHCAAGVPVISFQNGVDNLQRLRRHAPTLNCIGGMVPFNVIQVETGFVQQTSDGVLGTERNADSERWQAAFAAAGLRLQLHRDIHAVQWGKLLLNLNNPINALAGIPLRQQLLDPGYRLILADLQSEALRIMRAAGIRPARVTPLPARWLPHLLRLPTFAFQALAQRMLRISAQARSSMYDDRQRGRRTEVDDLCGAVVRLAQSVHQSAPLNAAMAGLIEQTPPDRRLSAAELRAALHQLL